MTTYTQSQIENAKKAYTNFMVIHTVGNYDVNTIGVDEAESRRDYHNGIVNAILDGNKEMDKEWKKFFLNEQVKSDRKVAESKAKLSANKEASADILAPIKALKKIGEFSKWLNTPGNPFRKENFSKKYTAESVNTFISTL